MGEGDSFYGPLFFVGIGIDDGGGNALLNSSV
jgi:hypothetical protein